MPSPETKKSAPPEEIFSDFGISATVRRRAAHALARWVDERIRRAVDAAREVSPRRNAPRYLAESLGGGIERAQKEGQRLKREILARPEMLPPERAASLAGITRQALDLRRDKGQALALAHVKRGFRYPGWQFDDVVAQALMRVLRELAYLDPWGQYFFLTEPEPLLEGKTPIEALRAGKQDRVLKTIGTLRENEVA